ncbi:GTPase activating protein (GAP) for Rho1p [Rhodotorula kratochvilovae]
MADHDAPAPSKASLVRWWKAFTRKEKEKERIAPPPATPPYSPLQRGLEPGKSGKGRVFGVPLNDSLQYASVAISLIAEDGNQYVYGYVPIVVAKCGMMLKETATQTEGIFRVSGSNKRINQLQAVFDEPPRYGKDFDWTGYSVHDAASILRRYLNSLPEPVIPAGLYLDFTAVLQKSQPIAASIEAYRHLISLLPPASRYLLLYLLDFLSVFARCSDKNLMTASNLAVVFQPGLVSSRGGGLNALLGFPGFVEGRVPPPPAPSRSAVAGAGAVEQAGEHGRGKEVLEFLIEQQAHFMLGLEPPVDKERQKRKGVEAAAAVHPGAVQSIAAQQILARGEEAPIASTSALPLEGRGGATELQRRGSEKSVERRRLRKSKDASEGGKVKRSKTWGSSTRRKRAEGREPSPSPNATPATINSHQVPSIATYSPSGAATSQTNSPALGPPVDAPPGLGHRPSVKKKARKSTATPSPVLASAQLPPPPGLSPAAPAQPAATPTTPSPIPPAQSSSGGGGHGGLGILGLGKGRRRSMDPDAKR